ncbi:MAG: hypothetical protein K2Y21_05750 [Phycisphaerales bacterium]|nr:hypothetical protein [Phycisphaerales bacterium]
MRTFYEYHEHATFGNRPWGSRFGVARSLLGAGALALVLAGCASKSAEKPVDSGLREQGKELFPDRRPSATTLDGSGAASGDAKEDAGGWSVLLMSLKTDLDARATQSVLKSVRSSGVPEATVRSRGEGAVVVAGNFESPSDPEAQALLKRVKEIVVDGQRPYATAYLVPPQATAVKGSIPEWDLRNVRQRFGRDVEYTLQINIYTNPSGRATASELKECRKAAEDAVRTLRRDGVDAYYYHDNAGSTVTVGLFTQQEVDEGFSLRPGAGKGLRELQQKFPNGLVNGGGVKEKGTDSQGRPTEQLRPSFLVRVP